MRRRRLLGAVLAGALALLPAVARADTTADHDKATALYKRAAAILQSTFEFIPYSYADRVFVIRPGIEGVHLWTGYFTISFKGVRVS